MSVRMLVWLCPLALIFPASPAAAQEGKEHHGGDLGEAHASKPQPAIPTEGNPWFATVRKDLGTYFNQEFASGEFDFGNPTDQEQKISNIVGTCTCARAEFELGDRRYVLDREPQANSLFRVTDEEGEEKRERVSHITVAPHQKGKVKVFMEMAGVTGPKEASIDMQMTDDKTPHVKISWVATGAKFFEVTPPDVHLNEMTWNEQRSFTFEIASPMKPDFEITGHDELPPGIKLTMEKQQRGDRAVWVVAGTYGPGVDERANGATLRFRTDVDGKIVEARIVAFVKGPLTVSPSGFISLGYVPHGTSRDKQVVISPTDEFDLHVTELVVDGLRVPQGGDGKFAVSWKKEGKDVVVTLALADDMPRGVVRGAVKVHLDHPASPLKEFMFNAFVR